VIKLTYENKQTMDVSQCDLSLVVYPPIGLFTLGSLVIQLTMSLAKDIMNLL